MNQKSHVKKFAMLAMLVALIITLAACSTSEKVPYGSISNDPYASLGNNTVTQRQLYDAMRKQGSTMLAQAIEEKIFENEVATIDYTDAFVKETFDDLINTAIYTTSYYGGKDNVDKLNDIDELIIQKQRESFANSLYLLDNTRDSEKIFEALVNHGKFTDYLSLADADILAILKDAYRLSIAQTLYARNILSEELADEDHDNYIDEAAVVSYYESQIKNTHSVNAFIFSFESSDVATRALKQLNLKFNTSSRTLHRIPDLRALVTSGEVTVGTGNATDIENPDHEYHRIYTILNNTENGRTVLSYIRNNGTLTQAEYDIFYNAYSVSTSFQDDVLVEAEILQAYVQLHDLVNPNNPIITGAVTLDNVTITDVAKTYTKEDLTTIGTSVVNRLYSELIDFESAETGKSYSMLTTAGSKRYLIIKQNDIEKVEYEVNKDDSDNIHFVKEGEEGQITEAQLVELTKDAVEYALETKLTSTYISTKRTELLKDDYKVHIYDPVVRLFYEFSNGYSGTKDTKSGNVLAKFGDLEITVDEFYVLLEDSYGVNIALDLLVNEYLLNSSKYSVTAEKKKEFEQTFKDIITAFSNDSYSASGYPASLGRSNFVLLAFGANSNKEAIEQAYILPELKAQFNADYEAHYGTNVYDKLASLAKIQQENLKSITVSHLLVTLDKDRDGTLDDPEEYFKDMTEAEKQAIEASVVALFDHVFNLVHTNTKGESYTTIINRFLTEFNAVTVLDTDSPWYNDYYLKGIGLNAVENISTAITNTSNYQHYLSTSGSSLDKVFYNRALEIYDFLMATYNVEDKSVDEINADLGMRYFDYYNQDLQPIAVLTPEELVNIRSSFGYHVIITGSSALKLNPTAELDVDAIELDDFTLEYEDADGQKRTITLENADSEFLTGNQVEFYLLEGKTELGKGASYPTNITNSFTSYLTPVITMYSNTYMQRELLFKLLADLNITFHGSDAAANQAAFEQIRTINRRQLFNYILEDTSALRPHFNQEYTNLYSRWFEILED